MKKAMLFIIALLFTASVSAASLTLTDTTGNFTTDGGSIVNNGTDAVHVNSGTLNDTAFVHTFDVTNTGTSGAFRLWVDGTASSSSFINSFSVLIDGIEVAALTAPSYTIGVFNSILLGAGQTVSMVVSGDFEFASYGMTLQTPIPAALFLFAPALLGFLGLRRKSALAVAA